MKHPDKYRNRKPPFPISHSANGNNGFFIIPHYKIIGYEFRALSTYGEGWDHVSVTVAPKGKDATRCPTWAEMCFIKSLFWDDEEEVMELHPPRSQWVNKHEFCLHLWRPNTPGVKIPLPPSILVGIKD